MTIEINGIAHIQLTVSDPERCLPFWERFCHFMGMKTLINGEDVLYCIGSKTGVLIRGAPKEKRGEAFDQDRSGLHHICFRARSADDIDAIEGFLKTEPDITIIHPAQDDSQFAPGYYSILFEDPDGIRVEANYVPGKGHFGDKGRLGESGDGPANSYGEDGLRNI
jgi:catechol 2,3-dioxygenase-like lactoylglutathione lyase family enzyme